jgi:chromosome segregation ATPase
MGIIVVFSIVTAVAILLLVAQVASVNRIKKLLVVEQERALKLEKKVEASQGDLKKSVAELERRRTELQDARELSKKKEKRQAMALQNVNLTGETNMSTRALEDSQKALSALESTIEELKRENLQKLEATKAEVALEFQKQQKEKDEELLRVKKELHDALEDLKKQKKLLRPQGNKIDLKTLPDEAASEFSRVFRKAEHHERLHGIARAKLHLAQEKFTTLQKRYFAVCRELAVAVGQNAEIEPTKARDVAEEIVAHKAPVTNGEHDEGSKES